MARLFVSASSQKATLASAPITGGPCSISFFANQTSAVQGSTFLSIGNAAGTRGMEFRWSGLGGTGVFFDSYGATTVASTASGITLTNGAWSHLAAVETSNSSHALFVNGPSNKFTTATDVGAHTGIDSFSIAQGPWGGAFYDGAIAEVGMWNVALTDDEVAALANGYSPLLIRPTSLVQYWPLFGNDSPELDRFKNSNNLTLVNAPTKADHPRIFYPSSAM